MTLTLVSEAVEAYARAHTSAPAAHLEAVAAETRETLTDPQMLTGPIEGGLLAMLVFLARPRLVLELGTYSGYSALSMAATLPAEARIVTCEIDDAHADVAERHIAAAGQAERISVRRGPALETITALSDPVDLAFVDADKTGYLDYYEAILPRLSEHGVMAIDNVLWSGRVAAPESADDASSTRALRAFNDHVQADTRSVNVMLTVRDGLALVRRA